MKSLLQSPTKPLRLLPFEILAPRNELKTINQHLMTLLLVVPENTKSEAVKQLISIAANSTVFVGSHRETTGTKSRDLPISHRQLSSRPKSQGSRLTAQSFKYCANCYFSHILPVIKHHMCVRLHIFAAICTTTECRNWSNSKKCFIAFFGSICLCSRFAVESLQSL